jgi:hypothetical protein
LIQPPMIASSSSTFSSRALFVAKRGSSISSGRSIARKVRSATDCAVPLTPTHLPSAVRYALRGAE